MKVKLPTWASLALTVLATALGVLNQVFGPSAPWGTLLTAGIAALAVLGIGPLAHGSLTAMFHVPYQVALGLASLFATAATSVTAIHGLSEAWRAVLVGVLTALAGALTGPAAATSSSAPSPPPASPAQ